MYVEIILEEINLNNATKTLCNNTQSMFLRGSTNNKCPYVKSVNKTNNAHKYLDFKLYLKLEQK